MPPPPFESGGGNHYTSGIFLVLVFVAPVVVDGGFRAFLVVIFVAPVVVDLVFGVSSLVAQLYSHQLARRLPLFNQPLDLSLPATAASSVTVRFVLCLCS